MPGLYFEDLHEGLAIDHAIRRTVTETDNVLVTALTHNPAALHLDAEATKDTIFGERIVNSMFLLALVVGISVHETTLGTTIGNLGFEEVRFPKPVFHGDTIRVRTEVAAARGSKSRTDSGIVTFRHIAFNQRDEQVCMAMRNALMLVRPKVAK
ncbi:MaoC family dehydratase [Variovorax paradoxus]|nr:MaoC family dehydratase [Variovorax paradoxus]MBT2304852.1 MaoC family dehydratase [Variovorax paradoxus]